MEKPRILIVDDESDLRHLMETALMKEGFSEIKTAGSVREGWEQFEASSPDIAILDIMLPDGEGYDLCKKIREVSHIPILFLSAKSDETDKILGLALGGDDYITKPFSPKEVAFRVKAQLRRAGYHEIEATSQPKEIAIGPFSMNEAQTEVLKNGVALELTAKEMGLMASFMQNPNQILSKETLFERVWGEDFFGADNTLMVHIRRLREKIEDHPSKPAYLTTVKGLGYKFIVK
ncbi:MULTISPECIES: response regulator transcription factor [Sporosarcina]|uniref:DNA-binding response regulator, OmpR family, contains REC and winged-helix (WHTH) domain n=1 Tax=Sporosarcina newyorkensis TaxID=759851 RepID=A0A1T4YRW7_9BACL|nr:MULTISPECIES: response regulator transcription factor [Sporosarcina]MBY0223286.1 response regulator transcription factor [Sporosarcina aquimarina]SKB04587.1 DNA-binding response regulator, OmpR family, contains REC and winged-helix (wHTH) domain [Sporosarcina newyorkensis]